MKEVSPETLPKDPQAIAEATVRCMLDRDRFSAWLKLELKEIAPGSALVGMLIREEMLNGFQVCHGGVIFSLADTALAFACNTYGDVTVSIENNVCYAEKVRLGDYLEARVLERTRKNRIAVYDVTITNQENTTVAIFRGSVYRTSEKLLELT